MLPKPHHWLAEENHGPRRHAEDGQAPAEKIQVPARGLWHRHQHGPQPVRDVDGQYDGVKVGKRANMTVNIEAYTGIK